MSKSLIHGDKVIWTVAVLLGLISLIPVYSTSTYYTYIYEISSFKIIFRHIMHLVSGFFLLYIVHKIDIKWIKNVSHLAIIFCIGLLCFTMMQGRVIGNANASRWIDLPGLGSFQPSTLTAICIIIFIAQLLSKALSKNVSWNFSSIEFWKVCLSIIICCGLIFPSNFSTSGLLGMILTIVLIIGKFPFKKIVGIGASIFVLIGIYLSVLWIKPELFPNRVKTWMYRVENFMNNDTEGYQSLRAKNAIINGGITGVGPGKSIYKNILPQSSSDFIYAIIVEEIGIIGGTLIILLYLIFMVRCMMIFYKTTMHSDKLIVAGLSLWIVLQAMINIGVSIGLFPVTGQTLPLISTGGTSIWMSCISLGIILSISRKNDLLKEKEETKKNNETEG